MITNRQITPEEKNLLEFFASHVDTQKEEIINQINISNITRDSSPYYLILKFDICDSYTERILGYPFNSEIQVLHEDCAPTVFILFVKNGLVYEFEVYNADSSYMDYSKLCDGEVFKEF